MTKTFHKPYRTVPSARRTYDGVVYASRLEAKRAVELDMLLRAEAIRSWKRQPQYQLGDLRYRADFEVVDENGTVHAEDVKGFETTAFRKVRKLWPKYQTIPLVILSGTPPGWNKETIEVPDEAKE